MNIHFHVAPRYAAGSPAQVGEDIARRVADDELKFFEFIMEGMCGESGRQRAETLGLGGIVEQRREVSGAWLVEDLITGLRFVRPFAVTPESDRRRVTRYERLRQRYRLNLEHE